MKQDKEQNKREKRREQKKNVSHETRKGKGRGYIEKEKII